MSLSKHEPRPADRARRRGWSVRGYAVLFMVVLVAVAALAGVAVRTVGEQGAWQSAEADANFAASVAAMEIPRDLLLMHEVTAKLGANPQGPAILAAPEGARALRVGRP